MGEVPIDLVGRDRAFVEARGDLCETLVDVAIDFCGLLDLLDPSKRQVFLVRCVIRLESENKKSRSIYTVRLEKTLGRVRLNELESHFQAR